MSVRTGRGGFDVIEQAVFCSYHGQHTQSYALSLPLTCHNLTVIRTQP